MIRDRDTLMRMQGFVEVIRPDRDKPIEVVIRRYQKRRSLDQNALFHALVTEMAKQYAEMTGTWHSPEVWKELVKRELLGVICSEVGGKMIQTTTPTSSLNTVDFADLLERLPPWAWENFQIHLSLPDDGGWR